MKSAWELAMEVTKDARYYDSELHAFTSDEEKRKQQMLGAVKAASKQYGHTDNFDFMIGSKKNDQES